MDNNNSYVESDGFLFPFQPYDVQLAFMKSLYSVLENGGVGIFESPTGTGKSLSIICGALKWIKDFQLDKKQTLKEVLQHNEANETDDWFSSYAETKKKAEERLAAKEELELIEKWETKISKLREAVQMKEMEKDNAKRFGFDKHPHKKFKLELDNQEIDDDFLIEDGSVEVSNTAQETVTETVKIFYASRTHSQLLQFMNELKKTPYGKNVSVTCLGSRSTLCVNDYVKKLKSQRLINEKCSELLRNKTALKEDKGTKGTSCPFYKRTNVKLLQDNILVEPLDVEDLVVLGKEMCACPYYATRNSIPDVEMVVIPYNILLHKSVRESCGIKLKNNVVIIDEAHNLLDAINGMYSTEINGILLQESRNQLQRYYTRYKTRFSPKTVRCINMLQHVLEALLKYLYKPMSVSGSPGSKVSDTEDVNVDVISTFQFLCDANVDHINFFNLIQFCEESHIANKLHGFASKQPADPKTSKMPMAELLNSITSSRKTSTPVISSKTKPSHNSWPSAFLSFVEFLKALTLPSDCGKMICSRKVVSEQSYFKFLHLNPSIHFTEIVAEARSVVLAGGTMTPISDFVEQLFVPAGISRDKIFHCSFGHVVADSNISVLAVRTGMQNIVFDFTYESRHKDNVVQEFGNALLQIATEVPGGVVCFFPSYIYEQFVYSFLQKKGLISAITKHKPVFREPKESNLVETLLDNYSRAITDPLGKKGAILFSVVGGKMSEGINFSDDMCRCVIMIGLPYAKKDKVCEEKLSYIKQFYNGSNDNYSIMCMKAVNQSIGRAIRHKNDYAVIMLLDYRYCHSEVLQYMPSWLSTRISKPVSFNAAISDIKSFFMKVVPHSKKT